MLPFAEVLLRLAAISRMRQAVDNYFIRNYNLPVSKDHTKALGNTEKKERTTVLITDIWAKTSPFQSVLTHAMVSGTVAEVITESFLSSGTREQLAKSLSLDCDGLIGFVGYLASLHDIGKAEYSFQAQDAQASERLEQEPTLYEWKVPGIRHEKTGQDFLRALWKEQGENRESGKLLSKVVGAHHQGKNGKGNYRPGSGWQELRVQLEEELRECFLQGQRPGLPVIAKDEQGSTAAILLGVMILSDWIASGGVFENAESWIREDGAKVRIRTETAQFLQKNGMKPILFSWPQEFCRMWPMIPADGLRPMQREIELRIREMAVKPLAVLIEAPMGEGKTEAGLYAALQMAKQWGKDGFYIALPTAATANQMVGRAQQLLRLNDLPSAVRLLHSMAWLEAPAARKVNSQDEQREALSWLAPLKRGLLGQFAVGTVDQAMLAATNVKYGVLRLLGLSNKVLIIDEIHSYDAYMSEILVRLLEWCKALQIPVVMLSATLPPALKEKLLAPYTSRSLSGAYPLITMLGPDDCVHEHTISETSHRLTVSTKLLPVLNQAEKIAQAAIREVEEGGCLCVLMNTVKEAQAVYMAIKERYQGELLLFHAQFPAGQRAEIEHLCIKKYGKDKSHRPKRSIIVATQVVEQSLDVDFDLMLTAVAPIDLLLQRMGRVFRHEDTDRPASHTTATVAVMVPDENESYGASAYVYPECLLNSAVQVLQERERVRIPEDLAAMVREGYDPGRALEEEAGQWMKKLVQDEVEAGASQQYLLNPPDKLFSALEGYELYEDDGEDFGLSAKTRLGEPTVRIALLNPNEVAAVQPFIKTENGHTVAAVWDRTVAERVMRQSLSVRISRLGGKQSGLSDIKGTILLSGTRIIPADENRTAHLENGRIVSFDPELGLIIKEGEL